MLPVRAIGQYGVQVENTRQFLQKLVGTMPAFTRDQLNAYFRGLIITQAKTVIAQHIVRDRVSFLQISAQLEPISKLLRERMVPELNEFGLKLVKFYVTSINMPENDPAVTQLKSALAKRAEMSIIGYTYQQERSFDTMEAAAGNPGSVQSGLMGVGMGLGLGGGMGSAVAAAVTPVVANLQPAGTTCANCRAVAAPGAAFCPSCGSCLIRPRTPRSAALHAEPKRPPA